VSSQRFRDVSEVTGAIKASWNGQQASIFTADAEAAAPLVDTLSTVVGRINLNVQCGRSPDVVPFSGRRSSAQGTMSVSEALRVRPRAPRTRRPSTRSRHERMRGAGAPAEAPARRRLARVAGLLH
jgi:acyl-CoA reductase-like NAD-dependent aldehyde dehydrogenase